MIERYTLPDMAALWTQTARYDYWLRVELAAMAVQEAQGLVPEGTSARARALASFDPQRIDAIEAQVKHDVIAFLTNVGESLGEDSRFLHLGMTSSDLIDTALALQLQDAGRLLRETLADVCDVVQQQALAHRHTVMIGRSHGVHGEPITFGWKLLGWLDELQRHQARLAAALEENRVGQLSGAMGTYPHTNTPEIEALFCQHLGLRPAKTSTQVISRDIHATWFLALGNLASSLEKFATELRHLQRTEVLEVEEAFSPGQKGSSAMPHKRNPISGENLTGLARLVRAATLPALENIALWHERDISHSAVERVQFPDTAILTHYMLRRFYTLVSGLVVHAHNMARNMSLYGGVVFSQRVMLALVGAGMLREDAYRLVQQHAHAAWNNPTGNFRARLAEDPLVLASLSPQALDTCFDPAPMLAQLDVVYARFGL
jgi:adenylosuccinate lyase